MKTCESNSERLSALADGELGGLATWRLRRHVARCADCTRALADWERMTGVLRGSDPFASEERVVYRERGGFMPRIAVAATVLTVATGIGLFYAGPSRFSDPLAAQASVKRALSDVRTAQWEEETDIYTAKTGELYTILRKDLKARLDPPVLMWTNHTLYLRKGVKAPRPAPLDFGVVKIATDARSWYSFEAGKGHLGIDHNVVPYLEEAKETPETVYQQVRRTVFNSIFMIVSPDGRKESSSAEKHYKSGFTRVQLAPTTSRITNHDGRRVIEISEFYALRPGNLSFQYTVWADPQSFWIQGAESRITDLRAHRVTSRTLFRNFRYNLPLSDADLAIPTAPGTTVFVAGTLSPKAGR